MNNKFIITALGLATALVASGCSTSTEPDAIEARVICQNFVKDRLKSPKSADFSDNNESGAYPTWTSTGNVDAENSFGAALRSSYSCTVTYKKSTDTWKLDELTGLDE